MPRPPAAPYGGLLRAYGDPRAPQLVDPPRRAVVTSDVYDGTAVTLELLVIARARAQGLVCVRQDRPGATAWDVWVPADRVRPL